MLLLRRAQATKTLIDFSSYNEIVLVQCVRASIPLLLSLSLAEFAAAMHTKCRHRHATAVNKAKNLLYFPCFHQAK